MSPDGVLVLMDLGSALMSAEFAVEMLEGAAGPVRLSAAPLVEGAVAAAVAAAGGASLDEVAAEARGALAMKTEPDRRDDADAAPPAHGAPPAVADATAELAVRNAIGLHARPAARFVETARGFDADVRVAKAGARARPVSARSLTNLVALGARFGDTLVVTAARPAGGRGRGGVARAGRRGVRRRGGRARPPRDAPGRPRRPPRPARPLQPSARRAAGRGRRAHRRRRLGRRGHRPRAPSRRPGRPARRPPIARPRRRSSESARLEEGIAAARAAIERDREVVTGRAGAADAAIFDAHLALLDDDALLEPARAAIAAGATAERAVHDAAQQVAAVYRGLDEPLLRERATDVLDVGRRVVDAITGSRADGARTGVGDRGRRRADPRRRRRAGPRARAGHRHRAGLDHRPRRDPGPRAGAARRGRPRARTCSG